MRDRPDLTKVEFFHSLSADERGFHKLADWLQIHTGIYLPASPKNFTLMASRLVKIMPTLGLRTYAELFRRLEQGESEVQKVFITALTTNKTEFFREAHHFQLLPAIIQDVLQAKAQNDPRSDFRIWCAAASRGHEPYSILFTLLESGFKPQLYRLKFLASDINESVLQTASRGVYLAEDLFDVPLHMRDKYMIKLKNSAKGERWKVRDELRSLITFACFNLVEFPYPFEHSFDIIFCRNVLIYFDKETTLKVKKHLAEALAPHGYLFIGHSESGSERVPSLQSVDNAVYKKQKVAL